MRIPANVDRRAMCLRALSIAALGPLQQLQLPPAHAISATTMAGKSKPELRVVLVDEVKQAGNAVSAEVLLSGGKAGIVNFDSALKLAEGGYYDIETKAKDGGDGAFVQVATLPKGQGLDTLKKDWFLQQICSVEGRYGAYGAPIDAKVLADDKAKDKRQLDISFSVLRPDGGDTPRRGVVSAVQPAGTGEVVMLVSSSSSSGWKKGGESIARNSASSFKVATRPSDLAFSLESDYRFGKTSGPSNMKSRNDGF